MAEDRTPKPEGWRKFDALARRIARVPKDAVDAKMAKDKAARIKARKKR